MVLDLSALCLAWNAEEEKEVHIGLDAVKSKMGTFPIIQKEPFTLHLTNVENRRLLIRGEADVTLSVPCDRCLAEVLLRLHLAIDKNLLIETILENSQPGKSPQGSQAKEKGFEGEDSLEDDDHLEQLEYMNGCQLDADRLIYGEILFAWPGKVLCADDCKGICAKCGANLNETDCGCDRTVPDPRMAAFQEVFNKFKEV
ncbi:MAG: DUF177 domain-containing protein [Eubacterium sp.]|nr:DUF177 domain-containing protein [Eubacterium sp.]